jgi:hypothetical protein
MGLPAEDVHAFSRRPHWSVTADRATFAPVAGGWRAVVVRPRQSTRHTRYHIAIQDRTGAIRYTREAATVTEAVRSAERDVDARNALRLVRRH